MNEKEKFELEVKNAADSSATWLVILFIPVFIIGFGIFCVVVLKMMFSIMKGVSMISQGAMETFVM